MPLIHKTDRTSGRIRTTVLPGPPCPADLLGRLVELDDPVLLESAASDDQFGRYSIIAAEPLEVMSLRDGRLCDRRGEILAEGDDDIWAALGRAMEPINVDEIRKPGDCPYTPGWIGYIGYEVGRIIEQLPCRAQRDTALPDMRLAFYDALLIFDAAVSRWSLVELTFDNPPAKAGQAATTLREMLTHSQNSQPVRCSDNTIKPSAAAPPPCPAESNFTPQQYRAAIAKCVDYIAAGDIFQVNLSQRFCVENAPDSASIYRELRLRNPAWYSAYMRFPSLGEDCAIVSSSPELFLRIRGREILTRPIKGTRPRIGQATADNAAADELIASEKDNAELAMIIDLLRNDLGRICRYASVRVSESRRLETHPTVFHLVGTVVGELRPEVGPAEVLRATFPGGSITGAPKIRAMEIIDELEPVARGVYTGCVGIVGVDGSAEWNIAIRTIVCDGGRALIQAGGGIVADSTPTGEYDETLDKARAPLAAIANAK
ncbi:MAG: aminodeoxychorismate synthase component I [Phycisphaerae bacterium]|nr:aminodeoxychorismate synthase component I [Phycisphaerae bacterium]